MTLCTQDSGVIILETEGLGLRHLRPEDAAERTARDAELRVAPSIGEPMRPFLSVSQVSG